MNLTSILSIRGFIHLLLFFVLGGYGYAQSADPTSQKIYSFSGGYTQGPIHSPFRFNILEDIRVIEDLSGALGIDEVAQSWQQRNPKSAEEIRVRENVSYWLKTKIKGNRYLSKHIFQIGSDIGNDLVNFNIINAYYKDGSGKWVIQSTGLDKPLKERVFEFWSPFISVDVPESDIVELFVQVKMNKIDKRFLPEQLGINHIDESSIWPNQIYLGIWQSIFYAILIFQFVYVLLLYLMEREKMQLYLAILMVGSFLGIAFTLDNFRDFVILSSWRSYHDAFSLIGIFFVILGQVKFTQYYFDYPDQTSLVKKVIPTVIGISGIAILISSFTRDITARNPLPFLLLILAWAVSFYMASTSKQNSPTIRKLYFAAFLPPALVLMVMLLYSLELNLFRIDNYNRSFVFLKFGILITMSALALSAGYRTRKIKDEKEEELKRNLKAEQEINRAINKFVPNEFISALGRESITEVQLGDHTEREVTVLFSDIRGYTSLSEKLSPTDNFKFVSDHSAEMGPIIRSHNGFINQYLGDGIMALFIDNPKGALMAAIDMHKSNNETNQRRIKKGQSPLQIGIGLHSGPLIMGVLGDDNRYDAATISDTVNAAARLEGLTKLYGCKILLSEASMEGIDESSFGTRYLGPVRVKGKEKALKIFECYDGDQPDLSKLKSQSTGLFNKGIRAYFDKHFDSAITYFDKIISNNPEDSSAILLKGKAVKNLKEGVASDWLGVESVDSK